MSVAPPPATYTATNDLNILKNMFVPQYQFSNGYFHASVNTQLPGNVTVGDSTTNFLMTVNNRVVMTLSDLQNWSYFYATSNVVLNSNAITTVSKLTFLGGNTSSTYTIDATAGTINVSQYSLKSVPLTLSGGLPAWAAYPASGTVLMNSNTLSGTRAIVMVSGASITNPVRGAIAFSGVSGETMRLNPSGLLGIGTATTLPAGYALDVSGYSMFSSILQVVTSDQGSSPSSNSFFVQTISAGSTNYDVRLGALGPNTNLFFCTGNGNGTLSNTNQIKIDGGGNMTLSNGGIITSVSPTTPSTIGGVRLHQFTVTCSAINCSGLTVNGVPITGSGGGGVQSGVVNIATVASKSVLSFSNLPQGQSPYSNTAYGAAGTTFVLTDRTVSEIDFPPSTSISAGSYWTLKNFAGGETISISRLIGGSILDGTGTTYTSNYPILPNAYTTIIYSGIDSNYYAL